MALSNRGGATIDSLPNERQDLLLHCCLEETERLPELWSRWQDGLDWQRLDLGSQRLLPLLYYRLGAAGIRGPDTEQIARVYRYHWYQSQLLLGSLPPILDAFAKTHIKVLVLKGAALAHRYYPRPTLRPMSDLDLMVRPEDLDKAFRLLQRMDWTPEGNIDPERILRDRLLHAIHFSRGTGSRILEVDLHWAPFDRAMRPEVLQRFWDHATPARWAAAEALVLDPTHQLLHTCIHGSAWNQVPSLRWVVDAMLILRRDGPTIDWNRLLADAKALGSLLFLKTSLAYLHRSFGAPIPRELLQRLDEEPVDRRESLEFRVQTRRIGAGRLDQLLMLEWLTHRSASPDVGMLRRLATFPRFLKHKWKLESWRQSPGFLVRRLARRLTPGRH